MAVGHVLVERDLIDSELVLVNSRQANQRLTNGPGSDYVDDVLGHRGTPWGGLEAA